MIGHLIHLGFPKAGSHVLRRWFTDHPQLAYEEGGIAGFRDVYQIAREGVGPRPGVRYHVTSSEALSTPHLDAGRPIDFRDRAPRTGLPAAQAAVCATLAALFPTAHVLVVTRGFRSMILSMYSQFVRIGAAVDFPVFCELLREPALTGDSGWDYGDLAHLYAKAFGEANLTVVPYELLRDDPDSFIRTIETRLGLEHFALTRDRLNASLSGVEMYWYPRLTRVVNGMRSSGLLRRAYLHRVHRNRFSRTIALLQWLRPGTPVTLDLIPDDLVQAFQGQADYLRGNPLYAPYARDYLF